MTDEKTLNIYQRMLAVMEDVSYVQKEDRKVNNQYTFVSHDAVMRAVRGPMIKHGVYMSMTVESWEQEGERFTASVIVRFINADDQTNFFESQIIAHGFDKRDMGPGKAISYAVKYALLKALMLETGDDPERDNIDHETPEPVAASKPDPTSYAQRFRTAAREMDFTDEDIDEALKKVDGLTDAQKVRVRDSMEAKANTYRDMLQVMTELNPTQPVNTCIDALHEYLAEKMEQPPMAAKLDVWARVLRALRDELKAKKEG